MPAEFQPKLSYFITPPLIRKRITTTPVHLLTPVHEFLLWYLFWGLFSIVCLSFLIWIDCEKAIKTRSRWCMVTDCNKLKLKVMEFQWLNWTCDTRTFLFVLSYLFRATLCRSFVHLSQFPLPNHVINAALNCLVSPVVFNCENVDIWTNSALLAFLDLLEFVVHHC